MAILIGISGGSGSGKTSFIRALKNRLPEEAASFISFDNYYFPREMQKSDQAGVKNFDLPESMDYLSFKNDLRKLQEGQEVSFMEYTFNNAKAEPKEITILPAPVIIIEGLFIYHFPELRKSFDLKIFINAEDEIKLIRRIKRDQVERNYPLEDVLYRYERHVMPAYDRFIAPYIPQMHLIVNNNENFDKALEVLKAYILSSSSN